MIPHLSERALILAPRGRDAPIAKAMLAETGMRAHICTSLSDLTDEFTRGAGYGIITEEALRTADLHPLVKVLGEQPEWSDFPFILLTERGGGLERNPAAGRYIDVLGNVTFLERPFHPTTLISLAKSAIRGRRRQYEARSRLEALYEGEQRFRAAIEAVEGIPWTNNADGEMVGEQPGWQALTGQAFEDYQGYGWADAVHPDDVQPTVDAWRAAVAAKRTFVFEHRVRRCDGEWRQFSIRAIPSLDAKGEVYEWVGVHTDVTRQRDTERALIDLTETLEQRIIAATAAREEALARLHEAQKLETIGQLTGGVAHDFNNLLTPITGVLDLMYHRYGQSDPRTGRLMAGALQSAERAKTLVQRLLGFARRQALETIAVDLGSLLEGMRDLISSSLGPTIELQIVQRPNLPPALADPNQLELAILNLCVNARDAMPDGGMLTITAEAKSVGPAAKGQLTPGRYVRIAIVDTGTGMDSATLARAVEPFFSTKETGRGTGLGLSMVHGLAAQLGGCFTLASRIGEGTQAELWLQVADIPAAIPRPNPTPPTSPDASLRVLLVDDEELVREGVAAMLRELGHEVWQARGAAEALAQLATDARIDLVITDYKLPRMDGAELALRLRETRPEMPVLLITGYTGLTDVAPDLLALSKPFRQHELARAIETLIGQTSTAAVLHGGRQR